MSALRAYSGSTHDTIKEEDKPTLTPYRAASDDHRYLRIIICAVFNAQPIDVSEPNSARTWHKYIFDFFQSTAPNLS